MIITIIFAKYTKHVIIKSYPLLNHLLHLNLIKSRIVLATFSIPLMKAFITITIIIPTTTLFLNINEFLTLYLTILL